MKSYLLRQHTIRLLMGGLLLNLCGILLLLFSLPLWFGSGGLTTVRILVGTLLVLIGFMVIYYGIRDLVSFFRHRRSRWLKMILEDAHFQTFGLAAPGILSIRNPLSFDLKNTAIAMKSRGWYKDLMLSEGEKKLIIPGLSDFLESSTATLYQDLLEAQTETGEKESIDE